jgi:glycosyltransferase involved in cell wall biosynthesis
MQAMARCLFTVVPSLWPEPFGLTAVEGMRYGKAIVASSIGGLVDIVIPRETGLLVPAGDASALAASMGELLENREFRQRLGEAGKQRLKEEFTADVVVPRIEAVYRKAIGCEST